MINKKGFTLIELMVVIAVIAILSTVALFGFRAAQAGARDTSRMQIMSSVRAQLERYYGDNNSYPAVDNAASPATGFVSMATTLGYPTAALVSDPGCGGGSRAYAAGEISAGGWYPTLTNCTNRPLYQYKSLAADGTACTTAPCPKYTLTLTKENGGTGTSNSPQ